MASRVDEAFDLHKKIIHNVSQIRKLTIENFQSLAEIKKEQYQKEILGDEEADFVAYLGQVDVFYSRSAVLRWQKILDRLVTTLEVPIDELYNIPDLRLRDITTLATDKEDALELLSLARGVTAQDWKNIIRERKGLPITDDGHAHVFQPVEICSLCGMKHAIKKPV